MGPPLPAIMVPRIRRTELALLHLHLHPGGGHSTFGMQVMSEPTIGIVASLAFGKLGTSGSLACQLVTVGPPSQTI